MAFVPLLGDGFDNYDVGLQRWTIGSEFHASDPISSSYSRHAFGKGAFMNGRSCAIELPDGGRTAIIMECAMRLVSGGFQPQLPWISYFKMDVTNFVHCQVRLSESRHPYFTRGENGAVIGGPAVGPTRVIEIGNWYWIQFYASIHASTGVMKLWVNGDPWLEVSNVNTRHSGASSNIIDGLQLSTAFGIEMAVDDVAIQDGLLGEFQGDMIVLGKRPIAAGYITDFTPIGDTPNFECVDEHVADEDTTYVTSDVVGERDSYIIEDITEVPDTSIVLGVQQAVRHRKDQPGPRSLIPFVRVDTDETLGEERFPSETSYLTTIELPQTLQPDGVSAWGTVATFNALDVEVGQETADGVGS
jgi:hypothetical protein